MTSNVSKPVFSNDTGWFRYNYDENRLEFLNHNTKLVVQTWNIPSDQWESLPSQQEYCENIVRAATQQAQNQAAANQRAKSRSYYISIVATIIAGVCWYIILNDNMGGISNNICIYAVALIATSASVLSIGANFVNK